jgi:hypothetical protein
VLLFSKIVASIEHGMNNFGLISRMITDWAYPAGAIHSREFTRAQIQFSNSQRHT